MSDALTQLKGMTTVVADTGDFNSMREFQPQDATTNPTLILKAVQMPEYAGILDEIVQDHRGESADQIADRLLVAFGHNILQIIPGRVSTEIDARLSFDTAATVARARALIGMYRESGIDTSRILIKIAATWEGIAAAAELEREGIRCNLTLIFGFPQAVACAEARVQLISPFVGRIYDWYCKKNQRDYTPEEDPGVLSVRRIHQYYKQHGYATEVMGASFRTAGQVLALAGCDLLTISPSILKQLAASQAPVVRAMGAAAVGAGEARQTFDEKRFRFEMNEDAMSTEKLSEGLRAFVADARALEQLVTSRT